MSLREDSVWLTYYAIVVLLSIATIRPLYLWLTSPLRSIPGPRIASLTGSWRNWKYVRGRWMADIIALHRNYGPVVRIAPGEISITDQEALGRIYGYGTACHKTSWYDTWRYAGSSESVFATRDHKVHRFLRKRIFHLYSLSSILAKEHLIDEVLSTSLQQLRLRAQTGEHVRLDDWTMFFTYEVVSSLALGHETGFLARGEDVRGIIAANQQGFWLNANVGYLPGQSRWFANYYFLELMTRLGSNFAAISEWIDGAVATGRRAYEERSAQRSDFLQGFFDMLDVDGEPVSDEEVASEVGNFLGAGADTTGILIMATLKFLLENPGDYGQVRREIEEIHRRLGLGREEEVPFKELVDQPFLAAVIAEAVRLHPSIVYQLPRMSLTQGTKVGSYFIPAGATISMSPAAVNRSPEMFGADADSWRPTRWLDGDTKTLSSHIMTFGKGSRECVGKHLAMVEVHKYIASFVRNFDVDLVSPIHTHTIASYWFAKIGGVDVILSDRLREL